MSTIAERIRARAALHRGEVPAPEPTTRTIAVVEPGPDSRAGLLADVAKLLTQPNPPTPVVAEPARREFSFTQFEPVADSPDFRRIWALPRRPTFTPDDTLTTRLTERYKRAGGTMVLKPIQAFALEEMERCGGLVGLMQVGSGKTLTSFLAPLALGVERAVLMVPPELRDKIFDIEWPALIKHWRLPNLVGYPVQDPAMRTTLHVVAYSTLSVAKTADVLLRIKPQAIIGDEAHKIARAVSSRGKRLKSFAEAHPETKYVFLSGSLVNRSIKDFAQPLLMALGDNAPVPREFLEQQAWSYALDANSQRAPEGVLAAFRAEGDTDAREGYQRRLVETPGVVATSNIPVLKPDGEEVSLNIHAWEPKVPKSVAEALTRIRTTGATPDGFEFDSALESSRYLRQVACGLWYVRTWPRGEPVELRRAWLEARNAWHKVVREYLTYHNTPGMDSPLLLAQAAESGRWKQPEWPVWRDLKDKCEPATEDRWVEPDGDFLVDAAMAWEKKHGPAIIFVEHAAFGRRLAEKSGLPFYAGGEDSAKAVDSADGKTSIICSQRAHGTGRNLQAFHRVLVVTPSSSGKTWEQVLGRPHREGQTEDVDFWVAAYTPELSAAVASALADARFTFQITKATQKLLLATFTYEPRAIVKSSE